MDVPENCIGQMGSCRRIEKGKEEEEVSSSSKVSFQPSSSLNRSD